MLDAKGYKVCDPPEWLRINRISRLLPSDDIGGSAPRMDWAAWLPWVRQRVKTWNYEQLGSTIGCSAHAIRVQVGKWVREGKLSELHKRRGSRIWSDTLAAQAWGLFNEGLTLADVARTMHLDPSTIKHHFTKLGEFPWRGKSRNKEGAA